MPRRKKDPRGFVRETGTYMGKHYDLRAKTEKELNEKIRAKRAEIESGSKLIEAGVTVKEWGNRWVETYKSGVKESTRRLIEGRLVNYVYPYIGDIPVSKVRPLNCQEALNSAEGRAPDTVKKVQQAIEQMFRAAKQNGLCVNNPAEDLKMPRTGNQTSRRSITDRERVILLETAKTHPAGPWVLTLLYSGLRPAESLVLTYADITGGMITVNKAYDRDTRAEKYPKSDAGVRKIPIIPQLAAVLPKDGLFGELVFPRNGHLYDDKSMRAMWQGFRAAMDDTERELIAAGKISPIAEQMPPIVPYDLRHTFCTDLERAGVPLNVASKLMGHASIEITAKIYTHTGEDMIERAGEQLAALFSPTFSPINEVQKTPMDDIMRELQELRAAVLKAV